MIHKLFLFSLLLLTLSAPASLYAKDQTCTEDIIEIPIYPGERIEDFCRRAEKKISIPCSLLRQKLHSLLKQLPLHGYHPAKDILEGILVPGRYQFCPQKDKTLDLDQISQALTQQIDRRYRWVQQQLQSADHFVKNLTFFQILIFASIIEKEAAGGKQHDRVAEVLLPGVKYKRRLGVCSTVEYGLGYHRPFLLNVDIRKKTAYNSYLLPGLPPTPIAFASDEAIRSIFSPAKSGSRFFVFDWTTGKLHFSRIHREHQKKARRAIQNYGAQFGKGSMYQIFPNSFYEPQGPNRKSQWYQDLIKSRETNLPHFFSK